MNNKPPQPTFGEALKAERAARRIPANEFAGRVCVSVDVLHAWEADEEIPTGIQFTRIVGSIRSLDRYRATMAEQRKRDDRGEVQKPPELLASKPFASLSALPLRRTTSAEINAAKAAREVAPPFTPPPFLVTPTLAKHVAEAAEGPEPPPPGPADSEPKTFGEALRRAREKAGLTIVELGAMISVSRSGVQAWEHDVNLPLHVSLSELYELLGPSGLTFKVEGGRTRHRAPRAPEPSPGIAVKVAVAPPGPKPLAEMTPEELKREHAVALARVAEVRSEIDQRRERLLAMAKELE